MLKENSDISTKWPLALIIQVYPGKDGLICVSMHHIRNLVMTIVRGLTRMIIDRLKLAKTLSFKPNMCDNHYH